MQYLTQGYSLDAKAIIDSAKFREDVSEMIVVKDIELYSMCEHHILPFFGKAHIAYIPNGWITGLSKIARVVDVYSRAACRCRKGLPPKFLRPSNNR